MSHNLGYDLNIVKDRMIQLRNRYQLEKKRLETQQAENPKQYVESKWPLFEHLSFLSEHIPVRRSFRTIRKRRAYSEQGVKSEPDTDADSDAEHREDTRRELIPGRKREIQVRSFAHIIPPKTDRNNMPPRPINSNLRNLIPPRFTRFPRTIYGSRHVQPVYQKSPVLSVNQQPTGSEKFHAFGQFLTSSLIELPEKQALMLVDQFTSEIVQSYLKKTNQNDRNQNQSTQENHHSDDELYVNGHGEESQG